MLSKTIFEKLNQQVSLEYEASNLYFQMSAWCEYNGFDNCACFLRMQALEERSHMERIYDYLLDVGGYPKILKISRPCSEYSSLRDVFENILEHEKYITSKINELVSLSFDSEDFGTFDFLQWYVKEQHEEEKLFKSILDKLTLLGSDAMGLYYIDKDIKNIIKDKTVFTEN
jgi:ferritin